MTKMLVRSLFSFFGLPLTQTNHVTFIFLQLKYKWDQLVVLANLTSPLDGFLFNSNYDRFDLTIFVGDSLVGHAISETITTKISSHTLLV